MKQTKNISIRIIYFFALTVLFVFYSCNDGMDEYQKYIEGGEISYTGKIEDVILFPGNERILLYGLLKSDPKVEKVKVFWDNMRDSVEQDIERTLGVDTVQILLENLDENFYNFTFYTYDADGNSSIPVNRTGQVFGERYRLTLLDRLVKNTFPSDSGLLIIWGETNYLDGLVYTEITYTTNSSEEITKTIYPLEKSDTVRIDSMFLEDYLEDSPLYSQSFYKPAIYAIDTFATEKKLLRLREKITDTYLKNTSVPFQYSDWDGKMFGNLADWISNDSIKNHNGFGGYQVYKDMELFSVDAGFSYPGFSNGKIYQTIELPAGSYQFEVDINSNSLPGTKYLVASLGDSLPDITDLDSDALSYSDLGSSILEFSLSETSNISVGFIFDFPGNSEYCRLSEINLYKL